MPAAEAAPGWEDLEGLELKPRGHHLSITRKHQALSCIFSAAHVLPAALHRKLPKPFCCNKRV